MNAAREAWAITAAALLLSVLALTVGRHWPHTRATSEVEVTIVPIDAQNLECSGSVGRGQCAFDDEGRARKVDVPLRPFVTTRGELVVLSGLFESEQVQSWLRQAVGTETRVRVRCESERIGEGSVGVRFRSSDPFGSKGVVAADVRACSVSP